MRLRSALLLSSTIFSLASAFIIPSPTNQNNWRYRLRQDNDGSSTTTLDATTTSKKRVVVVGNGMVGQRFMEKLLQLDESKACTVASFCEEPRAAYNRVKLTSYFETREPSNLSMTGDFRPDGKTAWYEESNVQLYVGDKAIAIDTTAQIVTGASGQSIPYDVCVLATGSYPFVPPIPGRNRPGVFVYRTIEDLENMLTYAKSHNVKAAAVIGGGLLGLEAAKAAADMGLGTCV
jgi:nitrite reductase (NADH) large subunit